MVAPLSPTTKQYQLTRQMRHPYWGDWYTQVYLSFLRTGFNQKPPYIDSSLYVDIGEALTGLVDAASWGVSPELSGAAVGAANKARAKFVNKLGDSSSFGATLTAELKSSWATVSGGITSALLAANAVRRGRLGDAARILNFHPPEKVVNRSKRRKKLKNGRYRKTVVTTVVWEMPDGKLVAKNLANRWIWYSYGVKPLIQDIYNGMDVLTRPAPETRVYGSGTDSMVSNVGGFYQTRYEFKSSVHVSADVRVSNPNLWLANQLGLINPVQWFIEGVKLSFVVDWFSNLSQIVNQLTDFVGLEITRPVTTSKHVVLHKEFHPDYNAAMQKRRTIILRELSIPEARLVFAYERFQWQRGLNAISLLVGVLRKS